MTNEAPHPEKLPPDASALPAGNAAAKMKPASAAETTAVSAQPPPANSLTPEEQMALFEKELKENDWGHQPC